MPVDRDRRIRLVRCEHEIDCRARRGKSRIVERPLAEDWGISGRGQEHVPLAQRHVEPLGEMQHHVAAWLRPSGLEKRQVPGRDAGIEGEFELAHAAARTPFSQMLADAAGLSCHWITIASSRWSEQLPLR